MKRVGVFAAMAALCVLLMICPAALAEGEAVEIASQCRVTVADAVASANLYDDDIDTYQSIGGGATLTIEFPVGGASYVFLDWTTLPSDYTVAQYAADGRQLALDTYGDDMLNRLISVEANASQLCVTPSEGCRLGALAVYSPGKLPASQQSWELPADKADIMIFSAHPDDEHLFFGGIMPHYSGELGYRTQVVYMSHQKRLRQNEALAGLWTSGVTNYPVFLGFPDRYSTTYEDAVGFWGEDEVLSRVVEQLRRFKPEVVVTHDVNGEYGHGAHRLTSRLVARAVELAADPAQYAESAEEYGVWQVKKLYLHMYAENQIEMDWRQPLEAFGGKTAFDIAVESYACHVSQHQYWFYVDDEGTYSCAKYGLAFTTVGYDVAKNDMLENIPAQALTNYVAPTPTPTQEPTPTPLATVEPIQTIPPDLIEEDNEDMKRIITVIAGAALSALLFIFAFPRLTRKGGKPLWAIVCALPLVLALLLCFVSCTPTPVIQPTVQPTLTSSPMPTPTPVPT
ncbi:MAG: PIG-L deacetylase family protein, partial [Clostridia bacterium]|nr:PIG-L deacetylase family protein [Clostridia bacterium]